MNGPSWVLVRLFPQKQAAGQIWPMGHSFLTPVLDCQNQLPAPVIPGPILSQVVLCDPDPCHPYGQYNICVSLELTYSL